ncbi:MAG TPA: PEP/pyruvate-binding domain-containing protein [Oligoflexia bacterium]|nr:PEP/pyruvate-binding domain-containing protein [Oligoflexia bacterium]HMP47616.1 PEP/pyruvate-binding domain-containing protein [Oligoflexia bacterium]
MNTKEQKNNSLSIINFDHLNELSVEVGAKGRVLSQLKINKIPVPETLVIPKLDIFNDVEVERCVNEILASKLLSANKLIVRSSANVEDGSYHSFAGQFKSARCDRNFKSIVEAIKLVLSSGTNSHTVSYIKHFSKSFENISLLIQEFHSACISGVAFTRHPVDPYKKGLYTEWTEGDLEHLVQGEITPHSEIIVDGVDPEKFPKDYANLLCKYSGEICKILKSEADIEWLVNIDGELIILQARPITSINNKRPQSILLRDNIGENYPEIAVPCLVSLASKSYYYYFRSLAKSFGFGTDLINNHDDKFKAILAAENGYLCYNLKAISDLFLLVPFFGRYLSSQFYKFIGSEEGDIKTISRLARANFIKDSFQAVYSISCTLFNLCKLKNNIQKFVLRVDNLHRNVLNNSTLHSLEDISKLFSEFLQIRYFGWYGPAFADAVCMITGGILSNELIRKIKPNSSPVASEFSLLLLEIRQDKALYKIFKTESEQSILDVITSSDSKSCISIRNFSRKWGYRRPGELLLVVPDFEEEPLALINLIKQRLDNDHEIKNSNADSDIRFAFSGGYLLSRLYLFGVNQREVARLSQAKLYNALRKILLSLGHILGDKCILSETNDIFYLTIDEIEGILSGTFWDWLQLKEIIEVRKQSAIRYLDKSPLFPLFRNTDFTSNIFKKTNSKKSFSVSKVIKGTGASAGVVQGMAQVVTNPDEIINDSIVITAHTDPAWVLYLPLIKGLIVERGGILSHAAIVSREFNVPTIVGVPGAMETIQNGQILEIDGEKGEIRII